MSAEAVPIELLAPDIGQRPDYNFSPAIFDLTRHDYGRILSWVWLYEQILPLHGDCWVFGVGWGRDVLILSHLRHFFEPSVPRRVFGFDTFEGVPASDITEDDGPKAVPGYCSVPDGWVGKLQDLVARAGSGHPSADRSPGALFAGRVQDTLPQVLDMEQAPVALAMIDYTIEEPTRYTLEMLKGRFVQGSLIAFNQFHTPSWKVEAKAVREILGHEHVRVLRNPFHRYWAVVEIT